jgi:ABC-type uncharacterized transport system ATPase subunit
VLTGSLVKQAYPLATFAGLVANATFGLLKGGIMGAAVETTGDLVDLDGAEHVRSESGGLRQRLAFDPQRTTTTARVLAAVSERAEVLDLSITEPDIEDVVREICRATRH